MADADETDEPAEEAEDDSGQETGDESSDADDAPEDQEADDGDASEKKKKSKKKKKKGSKLKLILIGVVGLFVLLGGTGAGLYFAGVIGGGEAEPDPKQEAKVDLGAPVFHTYEEMFVDLRTGECRAPFLRFELVVQISEQEKVYLSTFDARLRDRIINHIRSYERQDLVGEQGANRIRTDLVAVINNVIKPAQVHAVLFNSFILN